MWSDNDSLGGPEGVHRQMDVLSTGPYVHAGLNNHWEQHIPSRPVDRLILYEFHTEPVHPDESHE